MLAGCAGGPGEDRINPPPPNFKVSHPPPARASSLTIPISLDLAAMLRKAEEILPDSLGKPAFEEFFGTGGPDRPACGVGCGYLVKRGPLAIRAEDDTFELTASFGYGVKCKKRIPCRGPAFTAGCGFEDEPPRQARLRLSGTVELKQDWSTVLHSRLDSLVAESPCKVTFLKVNVADMVFKAATTIYKRRATQVDSIIGARIELKSRVEKIWAKLSEPIQLRKDIYLALQPRALSASPLRLSDTTLRFTLGITAYPSVLATARPAVAPDPLPDLSPPDSGKEGFRLYLPVQLDYAEVNQRLRKKFRLDSGGLKFPRKRFLHVRIDKIELFGYGDKMMIKAHFHGLAKGTVYAVGVPHYDAASREVSVQNLSYSLESRRILFKTFAWIDYNRLLKDLQDLVTIPVGPKLDSIRNRVEGVLNSSRGMVHLSGGLHRFALQSVESVGENNTLLVRMEAFGKVEVRVD